MVDIVAQTIPTIPAEIIFIIGIILVLVGLLLALFGKAIWAILMSLIGAVIGGLMGGLLGYIFFGYIGGLIFGFAGSFMGSLLFGYLVEFALAFLVGILAGGIVYILWGSVIGAIIVIVIVFAVAYYFISQIIGILTALIGSILFGGGLWLLTHDIVLVVGLGILVFAGGALIQTFLLKGVRTHRRI